MTSYNKFSSLDRRYTDTSIPTYYLKYLLLRFVDLYRKVVVTINLIGKRHRAYAILNCEYKILIVVYSY